MISNLAYVHPEAKIGDNVNIMPFAFVGERTVIGDGCTVMPYSAVLPGTTLGRNNRVHGHTLLGVDPQDFGYKGENSSLIIGDDNEIRENVVIARGSHEGTATRIGSRNHIMDRVHICHDARVDNNTVLGISSIVAGNTEIEDEAIITNQVVVQDGVRIGRLSLVQSGCRVQGDVPPYIIVSGNPVAYHGVNADILSKYKGVSQRILRHIANAYRMLFSGETSVEDSVMKIEEQIPHSDEIEIIVKFIRATKQGLMQCRY